MLVSSPETYGSWNLNLPPIPKRSRLYFLEPIAIGTAYVEGLVSYICRLAEAHCVSPGVLIKQEILPSFRKIYTVSTQGIHQVHNNGDNTLVSFLSKPTYTKNPNEYGFLAFQYIEGLKPLVLKENLQSSTTPPWIDKALDTSVKWVRDIRAWCPKCFQEKLDAKQLVYEPLLWSIAAVTVCPHHHQPLQSRCPHCKKIQRPLTGKMQVARCSQCLAWLNEPVQTFSEAELSICAELEWHLWVAQQVMKVLEITPELPRMETKESIVQVLYRGEKPQPLGFIDKSTWKMQCKLLEIFAR